MTSRRWCFTLNNPEFESFPITEQWQTLIKNIVYQREKGTTEHFQGYLELKKPARIPQVKALLSTNRIHLEIARGSPIENLNYCSKEDSRIGTTLYWGAFETFEEWKKTLQSKRGCNSSTTSETLLEIQKRIKAGATEDQIAEDHFDTWVKHFRSFVRYQMLITKPRNHEMEIHVLQGPTGTGKSKWCMDNYPDAYWKQKSNWWDGYMNHETVIIDEYYGWLPFDTLLRLCDRYPMQVETKGGQVQFTAKRIIFTTNTIPSQWYKTCYFPAFVRRVTYWHVLPLLLEHNTYTSYGEALKHMVNNTILP